MRLCAIIENVRIAVRFPMLVKFSEI